LAGVKILANGRAASYELLHKLSQSLAVFQGKRGAFCHAVIGEQIEIVRTGQRHVAEPVDTLDAPVDGP